jgi:hypothetical protein
LRWICWILRKIIIWFIWILCIIRKIIIFTTQINIFYINTSNCWIILRRELTFYFYKKYHKNL